MTIEENDSNKGLGLLGQYLKNPEVKGAWYNAKKIKLDGYNFIDCRFDNCQLEITSTNFELERCYIDQSTTILYGGEIIKPIRLFNARYEWVYENMPYFAPMRNSDGTITLKA